MRPPQFRESAVSKAPAGRVGRASAQATHAPAPSRAFPLPSNSFDALPRLDRPAAPRDRFPQFDCELRWAGWRDQAGRSGRAAPVGVALGYDFLNKSRRSPIALSDREGSVEGVPA